MTTTNRRAGWAFVAVCVLAWPGVATAERMSAGAFQQALDAVAGYSIDEGEPRLTDELTALDAAIVASHGDTALRTAQANALAAFLASGATGVDAKWWAARHLYRIGGPGQVDTIAPLLTDAETSDIAIYALQTIPGGEATQALIDALEATSGPVRVGIINALAARGKGAAEALPVLDKLAFVMTAAGADVYTQTERAEVEAALHAIAKIGGDKGGEILADRLQEVADDPRLQQAPHNFFMPYYHAWLVYALPRLAAGELTPIIAFREIGPMPAPPHAKTGMAVAMMRLHPSSLLLPSVALEAGQASREGIRSYYWYIDDAQVLANLAEDVPNLPRGYQALAISALGERGVPEARGVAAQLAGSQDTAIRAAALRALGHVGQAEDIPLLLGNATSATAELARAAADALAQMPGEGIHDAIGAEMARGGSSVRAAGVAALSARGARDSIDAIWQAASDESTQVRVAAFNALATLGDAETTVLVARAAGQAQDADTRNAALNAMVTLARRTGTQAEAAQAVLDGLEDSADGAVYTAAVEVLGRLDDPAALPFLVDAVRSTDPAIQMAGIRALTNWPTADPLDALLEIAETTEDSTRRILAVRAAVGIVDKLPSEQAQLAAFQRTLAIDIGTGEKRRVLAGLARLSSREALALAESFLDDEDVADDAAFAVARIRANASTPSASHNADDAALVLDGDADTRWTTGELQHPGQWFQLSFAEPTTVSGVVLDSSGSANDYPRGYAVYASADGEDWGEPIATGSGTEGVTTISFEPVTTNALRIEQTGTADAHFWSIHGLELKTDE